MNIRTKTADSILPTAMDSEWEFPHHIRKYLHSPPGSLQDIICRFLFIEAVKWNSCQYT